MAKYDEDFKLSVVQNYEPGKLGFKALAKKYGLDHAMVRRWVKSYEHHGYDLPPRLATTVSRIQLAFTQPGKPTQNAYIESFNGRFRDECLNDHWFSTLHEARYRIEAGCQDYNSIRPHSALNYATPLEFAPQQGLLTDSTAGCS